MNINIVTKQDTKNKIKKNKIKPRKKQPIKLENSIG